MSTLQGTLIGDTYPGLIKTVDNATIGVGTKILTDGAGIPTSMTIGAVNQGLGVTGPINSSTSITAGTTVNGSQLIASQCITTTGAIYAATAAGNCVGIGTVTPNEKLTVNGSISANGSMYLDLSGLYASNGFGTSGQVLQSTGTGIEWVAGAEGGDCCGTVCTLPTAGGTCNYVSKFTSDGTIICNSIIQDNGSCVGIGVTPSGYKLKVAGGVCATGFTGNLTGNICGSTIVGGSTTVNSNLTVNCATSLVGAVDTSSTLNVCGQATLASARIKGRLTDSAGAVGVNGYVLRSTGSGIEWGSLTSLPSANTAGALSPGAAIGITGAVAGAGVTFTGASNININTTSINGSCVKSGTVAAARIHPSVKTANGKLNSDGAFQRDRVAYICDNGVMEIGKYIDFHNVDPTPTNPKDYDVRLSSNGTTLTVTGELKVTKDIIAFSSSDERLKDNKKCITDANNIINGLNNYCFDWNDKSDREGAGIGVLAQDVQKVLPNAVCERDNGYLAVDYNQFIPVLLQRVKELSAEVEELKAKIN